MVSKVSVPQVVPVLPPSPVFSVVVPVAVLLWLDVFPVASLAFIKNVYVVDG